jgi:hypothetical protein
MRSPVFDPSGIDQSPPQIRTDAGGMLATACRVRAAARGMGGGTLMTLAASDLSEAERCFVAYAARELRDEITVQLARAEAMPADPGWRWRPAANSNSPRTFRLRARGP